MATPQITVRNPSPELAERLRSIARERGESLNATILRLLESAVGIDERRKRLERYATWDQDDLQHFQHVLREQRSVDEKLWD